MAIDGWRECRLIARHTAAPLGDVRRLTRGDVLYIRDGAQQRSDWARYLDAIAAAVSAGADVRWLRDG